MGSKAGSRRLWSHDEDQVLRCGVEDQSSQGLLKNWKTISEKLPGRTNKDCRKRWSKVCDPVKKGPWSSAENETLKAAVTLHGYKWIQVAQTVETRHAERIIECAKRWKHSLDPSIDHSKWIRDDDARLLGAVERYGHDWRAIVTHEFPARSPTNVKNRHVLIGRKRRGSLALGPQSSSIRGDFDKERLEDSFDEDSDESDYDIDNHIHSPEIANIPDGRSNFSSSGGSTSYGSDNTPAAYTSEEYSTYVNNQETSYLPTDRLFSLQPTDSLFTSNPDSYLWDDPAMLTPQTEQWQPETVESSSLATTTRLGRDEISVESQMELDFKEPRQDIGGTRLILENVKPDTVGTILKVLCDSGTDIKMRFESTETHNS